MNIDNIYINIGGNLDGTFLIRESSTAAGDFVLTLLFQGEVCHYQIRRHGEDAFFSIEDKIKILHGLETLVDFYQQAANGLVTKLTKFIRKDPPPNDTRSQGTSNLLHRAVMKNNYVVVSELLKCGYRNVDAKNRDGQTAMHLIALHGDEKMLQLLIKAGVNVNCMDTANYMPLHVLYFINFLFNVYVCNKYFIYILVCLPVPIGIIYKITSSSTS